MFGYEGPKWVAYFWFVGWDCLSFGLHFCTSIPHIEIHLPFGFIRVGRQQKTRAFYNAGRHFRRNENMGANPRR